MWRRQHAGREHNPRTNVAEHRHDDHSAAQQGARDPQAPQVSHHVHKGRGTEPHDGNDPGPERRIHHPQDHEQRWHTNDYPYHHADDELASAGRRDPRLYPPDPRDVHG